MCLPEPEISNPIAGCYILHLPDCPGQVNSDSGTQDQEITVAQIGQVTRKSVLWTYHFQYKKKGSLSVGGK